MKCTRVLSSVAAVIVLGATLSSVTTIATAAPAAADDNPATANLSAACTVGRSSDGEVAGLPGVGPGERITVSSTLTLDAGQAYQDVIGRPDGTTYFASVVELEPSTSPDVNVDLASARLTVGGAATPFTRGTKPSTGGYVLDDTGGRLRLYFPGDADAMLANVAGVGLPSIMVPANRTEVSLTVDAVVGSGASVVSGATLPVGTCRSSMSTGPSARTTGDQRAEVGIAEPDVSITKEVAPPTVSPGSTATFTIKVHNRASDPDSPVAPAHDVVVTDTLPADLVPVNGDGSALADGATNASGLRWRAADRTLTTTVARIPAGATASLTLRVRMVENAPAASTFVNHVTATATSAEGDVAGERTYPPVQAQATLNSAAAAPTLTKTADRDTVVPGNQVSYTVTATFPPSSHFENVTLVDILPQGTYYGWNSTVSCAGCVSGPADVDLGVDYPGNDTSRLGRYLGAVTTGATPATITWRYQAWINSQLPGNRPVPDGYVFTNAAELRANIVDRLGGVTPRLSTLRPGDFQTTASASVMAATPALTIEKRLVGTSPLDPTADGSTWEVTLTNTGPVDATNVYVYDNDVSPSPGMWSSNLQLLSPSADFSQVSGNQLLVRRVPANGAFTFRYRLPWYLQGWTGASPSPYLVTNRAEIGSYADPYGSTVPMPQQLRSDVTIEILRPDLRLTKERLSPATISVGTPARYRVTLTNEGAGSATNVRLTDSLPSGFGAVTIVSTDPAGSVDCTGTSTLTCALTPDRVAPGQTITFEYEVDTSNAATGSTSNSLHLDYTDGTNRTHYTDAGGEHRYQADATATLSLVAPQLTLAKTPELDDPGATIDVNGTAAFNIVATNTGGYLAADVVIDDPMPDHLSADLASATCVVFPVAGSTGCVIGGTSGHPTFTVDELAPGAELRVTLPVRHDGTDPKVVGSELPNEATLSALGFTSITDDGGLNAQSGPRPPLPTKTVTPTSAGPGDTVTYTVDVALQDANATVFDATLVDTVPDGLTDVTPVSIACVAGSCPATLAWIGFEPSGNGGGRAAWFIGDQPLNTVGTVRVVYTARVAETFVGGGIPAGGTLVRDGVPAGDPLKNAARIWFNDGLDRFPSAPASVPPTTTSTFTNRSVNARVSLDVATPKLVITKSARHQSIESGDRSNPFAVNTYTVRVENRGDRPAYAVDVVDDMANGGLRDVVMESLPAGVTVTDPFATGDPTVQWQVDEIGPGEIVEIVYSATARPTADMADSRVLVRNTAFVLASHSTPAGAGAGDYAYPADNPVVVDVYAYTPHPRLAADGCSDPEAIGDDFWFATDISNYHWLGTPDRDDVGSLFDGVLTVILPADVSFVAGSVLGTPFAGNESPFRDPDTLVVNPDLSTTMTWDLGEVPIHHGNRALRLRWKVRATAVSPAGFVATLRGTDRVGATQRGDAIAAPVEFVASTGAGCNVQQWMHKTPDTGTIPAGTSLSWNVSYTISTSFHHPYTETGTVVDILPKGFSYTAGAATFSDGTTPASHNETITPLPDGRTMITWSSVTLTAPARSSASVYVTVPTRADDEATLLLDGPLPRTFVNESAFAAVGPTQQTGTCMTLTNAVCDTGQINVESNNQPTVTKQVDHTSGPWGDTATYTVTVSVPANYAAPGLFTRDYASHVNYNYPYWPANTPPLAAASISAGCVAGCTPGGPDDIVVTELPPETSSGYPLALGWKTGEVTADTEPRTLRFVYQVQMPQVDEVMALPGCSSYGMSLNSYYSCGKITIRNTVDLWRSSSPLASLGTNWWNQYWWYGMQYRGADTADFTASVPDLDIVKECAKPGEQPDGTGEQNNPTFIDQTSPGVANVACWITVTNHGPGTAYYVRFDDLPWSGSMYGWPVTWDLRSNTSPAPANVDTAPGGGRLVAWELPELAEGGAYTASFEARATIPPWSGGIASGTQPWLASRFANTARLTAFDPDDFGTVHIDMTNQADAQSTRWVDSKLPRVHITKQANPVGAVDPATLTSDAHCNPWGELVVDGHEVCSTPISSTQRVDDTAAPLEYHLNLMTADGDQLRTVNVADQLPLGWSYVPGSARLDHWNWDASGALVTTSTPLKEPNISATSATQCDWSNITGNGDRLAWVFSKAATDQSGALWDPALRWTGPSTGNSQFDAAYRITFQAAPNTMWAECEELSIPRWDPIGTYVQNDLLVDVTSIADANASFSASATVRELAPPRFTKSPDDGYASADGEVVFTLDTDNVQRFGIDDVSITDAVQDWSVAEGRPLYQPGSATITDEFGDPVDATETIVHRSTGPGDATIIRWTFDLRAAYETWTDPRTYNGTCPVHPDPSTPWWSACLARVRVTMGWRVPADEPDGTRYDNTATAVFPTRSYSPDGGQYVGFGDFDYGATLSDDGAFTVVNPSPPPAPTKSGPSWATPNDVVDHTVSFDVPAGATYHDLSYTDVVDDGLTVDSLVAFSCTDDQGRVCEFPTASTLGPVDNADGTTTIGAFFGEVPGVGFTRHVSFVVRSRVADRDSDDVRIVSGRRLGDRVSGFSNEDDLITGAPTAPVTSAQYESPEATFITTIDEPRVTVTKTADTAGPVAAGDVVNYTIRIDNPSNTPAYRVPVTDRPNAALTDVQLTGDTSAATKGWTPADPTLEWEFPVVWPGSSIEVTYRATVGADPQTEPAVVNTADVGSFEARSTREAGNREYDGPETEHTLRFLSADLRIAKVPNPTGADPCPANDPTADGQATTAGRATPWCVTVTNAGELTAGDVVVRDLLPPTWTYAAGSATVDGVAVEPVVSTVFGVTILRWDLGDLAPGAVAVVRYAASAGTNAVATAQNTAWATAQRPDGSAPPAGAPGFRAIDTATATLADAGVEIAKTPDRQVLPFLPGGGRATWDLVVTNPSATDLTGVVVTDTFPAGITYLPAATTSTCAGSVESAEPANPAGQVVRWSFPSLDVGETCTIHVEADVPAGLPGVTTFVNDAQVSTNETTNVAANQAKAVVYEPALLGDLVWHDLDGDGIQDAGEPGYPGVDVVVTGEDIAGNPVHRVGTTDADGRWLVDLAPGTYHIVLDPATLPASVALPTNRHVGDDRTVDSDVDENGVLGEVTIESGRHELGLDAGLIETTGVVSGVRWHDRNGNGIQDAGEEPIAGVTVTLAGTTTFGWSGSLTTVTDVDGYYEFTGLAPANVTITFSDDPDLVVTRPNIGTDPTVDSDADPSSHALAFFIPSGGRRDHLDEGTYRPSSVRGSAWRDVDHNGRRDGGEPPLRGLPVTLVGTDGAGIAVSIDGVTDAAGNVVFAGLAPGRYALRYGPLAGATPTLQDVGTDETIDSDADPTTGTTPVVTTASGDDVDGGDAGFWSPTNLTLSKSVISGPTADRIVTYRLRVTNTGDQPTGGEIGVVDDLPDSLTAVSADGGGWSCTVDARSVDCTTDRPLAAGAHHDVVVITRLADGVVGPVVNQAVVRSSLTTDNTSTSDDIDRAEVSTGTPVTTTTTAPPSSTTTTTSGAQPPTTPRTPLAFTGGSAGLLAFVAAIAIAIGVVARRRSRRPRV